MSSLWLGQNGEDPASVKSGSRGIDEERFPREGGVRGRRCAAVDLKKLKFRGMKEPKSCRLATEGRVDRKI